MNNANFRFDSRNSANDAKFEPIIDEVNEISCIKNITIFLIIKFLTL